MIIPLLTTFEKYLRFEKRASEHTITATLKDVSQCMQFIQENVAKIQSINDIKSLYIRQWLVHLNENKYAASSIKRKLSSLNAFYKLLLKRNEVKENPVYGIKAPKIPKRLASFLEQEESVALFNQPFPKGFEGETHQLILEILYQTGIRRAELINIKEQDIDADRLQLSVLGKGDKMRLIPISKTLLLKIQHYIEQKRVLTNCDTNNLLTLISGKPLYDKYVYRVVTHYLKEVTTLKKKSPHVLRHTFATHLSNNGAEINAVKDLLGHSSLAATQIYTHNNIEHLKKIYQKAHPKAVSED